MLKLEDLGKGSDYAGIEFLRSLVRAFDYRDEDLNGNKTPGELVQEFLDYINDITDLDGNKLD